MARFEVQKLSNHKFIIDAEQNLIFHPTSITASWDEANKLALTSKAGGYTGWRIPSLKELAALINRDRFNPSSDMPEIRSRRVCSRDVFMGNPNAIWVVNFYDGSVLTSGKQENYFVIFVRTLEDVTTHPVPDMTSNEIVLEVEEPDEEFELDIDITRPRDNKGRFVK